MPFEKVLIVDDEPDIRKVGQMSLELMGKLQVCLARSGLEALEVAAQERPDAILLDVMMPEMDGPATLKALRRQEATRAIPVIFMTAGLHRAELDGLHLLGAAGVIRKPFDPMTLPNEVRRLAGADGEAHARR